MQSKINTKALNELENVGFMLLSDKTFPSLVTQIVGIPPKGSWWGHPKGNIIFNASVFLTEHNDVLSMKLLSKKVTFVHRKWWPDLFNILQRRRSWQLDGISEGGQEALAIIALQKDVRSTDLDKKLAGANRIMKELEERSLVHSQQIHSESGKHVRVFNSWGNIIKQVDGSISESPLKKSYALIEQKINSLNEKHGGGAKLPWKTKS